MKMYISIFLYIWLPYTRIKIPNNCETNLSTLSYIYIASIYIHIYIYMIKPIGKNPPTNPQTLLSLANPDPYTETLKPAPALCD